MPTPDTRWGEEIEQRLDQLQADLQRNTAATEEVRDLLEAAKGAFRALNGIGIVVRWVGGIAGAGVAIWGAIYAITHGGRPPGGH